MRAWDRDGVSEPVREIHTANRLREPEFERGDCAQRSIWVVFSSLLRGAETWLGTGKQATNIAIMARNDEHGEGCTEDDFNERIR